MTAALLALLAAAAAPPQTVESVDLERYTGLWYEIAKLPNRFQRQCVADTTAEYRRRQDGRIDVVNRCRDADGEIDEARGIARVVDEESNAKLEVSFVRLLGLSLFWGDYWILGLADDYSWALVGHPKRAYGWILSRRPELEEGVREQIELLLRAQGYDPDAFEATPQSAP